MSRLTDEQVARAVSTAGLVAEMVENGSLDGHYGEPLRALALLQVSADLSATRAALEFLVGGEPTWECQHGVPLAEFCSKACPSNVVRLARAR